MAVLPVADRGFGDHKLYRVLSEELKFDFVIRFRGNIAVTATDGETRAAADWVGVPAVAREHCAALRSPPRRIRSPPWSACGRRA